MLIQPTELEIANDKIENEIRSILEEKIDTKEIGSVIIGPKTKTEKIKTDSFFRVIYEDSKAKREGKTYIDSQPIRITANVKDIDLEYGKQESFRLISWVADEIFKKQRLQKINIVQDVTYHGKIIGYPFERKEPKQIGSGIRFIVDYAVDFQCKKKGIKNKKR